MDNKLKHLELIQGVVNRLSNNSFLLKGWSVVLVSALFALSTANSYNDFVWLAYIPAVIFWGLDGYFLALERAYRKLYDQVRVTELNEIDFSMDIRNVYGGPRDWGEATLSKTLIPFHGSVVGAIVLVMYIQL